MNECDRCSGSRIILNDEEGVLEICPECSGNDHKLCPVCKGECVIECDCCTLVGNIYECEECSKCEGEGTYTCEFCMARGWV